MDFNVSGDSFWSVSSSHSWVRGSLGIPPLPPTGRGEIGFNKIETKDTKIIFCHLSAVSSPQKHRLKSHGAIWASQPEPPSARVLRCCPGTERRWSCLSRFNKTYMDWIFRISPSGTIIFHDMPQLQCIFVYYSVMISTVLEYHSIVQKGKLYCQVAQELP